MPGTMATQLRRFFCALTGALLVCGMAQAQPGRASVSGKLIDENGVVITLLEASVTLKDTKTGEVKTAVVKSTGDYEVTGLKAGTYDMLVPIACCMYRTYEQKTITLKNGEKKKLDLNIGWGINLGTIGDDPGQLSMDMRRRAGEIKGPAPRTAEGKVDFSGIWYNVPPPIGQQQSRIPMQPWALEIQEKLRKINQQGPAAYCLPQSAIPIDLPFPYKVVQTKDLMVHLVEFTTPGYRQVFLDGRPHPPADEWNPAWLGHSVGHYEGDTLVIESTGFNEITPGFGVHSEQLKIIERWTRPNRGTLEVEIIATDPAAWTGEYRKKLVAGLVPDEEILEFVCPENNLDALHNGQPWRGRP
jgi:hypothetical protein